MPAIPINERPYYNTDQVANSIAANEMFDCYLEPVPGVGLVTRRRPGLKSYATAGSAAADGVYYWDAMQMTIVASGGNLYKISDDGVATVIPGDNLVIGAPVVFAAGQGTDGTPILYAANGQLVYTDGNTVTAPYYVEQVIISSNDRGFASEVHDDVFTLSATTYTYPSIAVQVTFTNETYIDYSGITATITGTDYKDESAIETVTLPGPLKKSTSETYFKTLTSIVPSTSIGDGQADQNGFANDVTGGTWTITTRRPPDRKIRNVVIKNNSATDHSLKSVQLYGADSNWKELYETLDLPEASETVTSINFFHALRTATPSASIGTDTMDIGWNAYGGLSIGWGEYGARWTNASVPNATHCAFINGVFIANDKDTNRWLFTDTNPITGVVDHTYWGSIDGPLTCEAKGDTLKALFAAWQEIYAWGGEGLELWQNDGVTPFSPITGAFSEGGIESPYSVVLANNTVFALCVIADSRVVVKMQGRSPVVISEPIARVLADMDTVRDAIGALISVGGVAIYLLSFPSAGQTWAYDYKNDTWSRWGYFVEGEHQQFIGKYTCYVKHLNKYITSSRLDNKIYELDRATFNDAGAEMVSFRRTGWINHGTFNRKTCDQFYIKCKAGESSPAKLLVRWRDDGNMEWSDFMEVPLEPVGARDFLAKMNRMGTYRSRQYEFRISDDADLVLVSVDAELTGRSS